MVFQSNIAFPFFYYYAEKGDYMKTYFTLNNRRYEAKEVDFNLICDLSDMGINIMDMSGLRDNPLSVIRAYVALCMGVDKQTAGAEVQEHIIGGANFDEILGIITNKMDSSGFFQAISKGEDEENQSNTAKTKEKSK